MVVRWLEGWLLRGSDISHSRGVAVDHYNGVLGLLLAALGLIEVRADVQVSVEI